MLESLHASSYAAPSGSIAAPAVDSLLSNAYEKEAWAAFDRNDRSAAKQNFAQALRHAGSDVRRRGRIVTGQAWLEYWDALEAPNTHDLIPAVLARAQAAQKDLESGELQAADRRRLALLHHLLGLLRIELCEGLKAAPHLEQAATLYRQVDQRQAYFDVRRLQAKLYQCRGEYRRALVYLTELDQAEDVERRARAFLDRTLTLHAIGLTRDAWRGRAVWDRLLLELDHQKHRRLILRGKLLFALIAVRFGELGAAAKLLCEAEDILCSCDQDWGLCRCVLWTIRAELELERGDLVAMESSLAKAECKDATPARGYDCFDILVPGSECRQCVIETWTCEIVYCNVCCRCPPCFISFSEPHAAPQPLDLVRLYGLLHKGLRAKAMLYNGNGKKAERALKAASLLEQPKILDELRKHYPRQRALILAHELLYAAAVQMRDVNHARLRQSLEEIFQGIAKLDGRHSAFNADARRILGLWRSELGEDSLAVDILGAALAFSQAARAENHPDHLLLRGLRLAARANLAGADHWQIDQELDALLAAFPDEVCCHDHRRLVLIGTGAWNLLFAHCFDRAEGCFRTLWKRWLDRAQAVGEKSDPRMAWAIFGWIAARVEKGLHPQAQVPGTSKTMAHYMKDAKKLLTSQGNPQATAHELNRIGIVLLRHRCYESATYFFEHAQSIYRELKDGEAVETLAASIKKVELDRKKSQSAAEGSCP